MKPWFVQTKTDRIFDVINTFLLVLAMLTCFYPLYYIIVVSFSKQLPGSYLVPDGFTFAGYKAVFESREIWIGYGNTIFYTVLGVIVALAVTLPGAYALSRKDLHGRSYVMGLILITMFVNGGLIPTFLTVNSLGLVNTRWIIILSGAASAYNVIVARTFFSTTIPGELLEAAQIDGCGNGYFFVRIVLPLSKPIIAVIALYVGVARWNSYYTEMIYLRNEKLYPLALFLRRLLWEIQSVSDMLQKGEVTLTTDIMERQSLASVMQYVLIVVSTVPMMLVYPFLQKYFAKGIMIGSVKG